MGKSHCNALSSVRDCQFTAVADVRSEAAEETASKFGVKPFTDRRRMFDEVDAVIVATPPWQHAEVTVDAAKNGIHVFCEKPLSASLEDANAVVAATDEAGVVLMVGHVLRFYPLHELGRKMVDDGLIGEVLKKMLKKPEK